MVTATPRNEHNSANAATVTPEAAAVVAAVNVAVAVTRKFCFNC